MKVEFRAITRADYEQAEGFKRATVVAAMGNDSLFETWFTAERPYSRMLEQLQSFDPEGAVFIYVDGVAVGQVDVRIYVTESGPVGYLNNIYLEQKWRGQGLGEQMEEYATRFFKKHGANWATLKTNPKQLKVIEFYERMGWKYVEDSTYGMVLMGKDIV